MKDKKGKLLFVSALMCLGLVCLFTVASLLSGSVHAQTMNTINFQGKVVRNDAGSEGLNISSSETSCISGGADTCGFQVVYYDASSGGNTLGTETFTNVEIGDYDGVVNLGLGTGSYSAGTESSFINIFTNNATTYAEVKFDHDGNATYTEVFGRMAVRGAAYAIRADTADSINGMDEGDFVQFVPSSVQTDTSTSSSIFINKTGASGNILQLQKGGTDVLVLDNSGQFSIGDPTPASAFTVGVNSEFQVSSGGAIAAATGITSSGSITFSGLSDGLLKASSGLLSGGSSVNLGSEVSGTLAMSAGGTGSSLSDPGVDRIMFWDETTDTVTWLTAGTNLTITGTTIDASTGPTYTPGNDIDFNTNQIDIESILNFVQTITRDSGSITISTTTSGDLILNPIGNIDLRADIIPNADDTYDIGNTSYRIQDIFLGPNSLHIGTDGDEGTISFDTTGDTIDASTDMTIAGLTAGKGGSGFTSNTIFGVDALTSTTGDRNTAIGYGALLSSVAHTQNTAIGYMAMYYADDSVTGSDMNNVAIGDSAMRGSTTAANNDGWGNVAVGSQAMFAYEGAFGDVAVGNYALQDVTDGYYNTAVGFESMKDTTIGDQNVSLGYQSLATNVANSGATAIGYQSMSNADDQVTGRFTYNTAIGYGSLSGSATAANNTGRYNVALGAMTLADYTTGEYNIAVGHQAGWNVTEGSNNIVMGYRAGDSITTGNTNIIIGHDIDPQGGTSNNQLSIGNLIFATGGFGTGTSLGAGNVGIGDASPAAKFTVGDGDLFQVNSSGAIAAATGITSSGTITFSGISDGIVTISSGVLSTGAGITADTIPTWNGTTFADSTIWDDGNKLVATATADDESFIFYGTNLANGQHSAFSIFDQDVSTSSQDEGSVLLLEKSANLNDQTDGWSILELTMSGTVGSGDEEGFYTLGRLSSNGSVEWGVSLTDADIWTTGGLNIGATGTDCGGTDSPCFNTPLFAVGADGQIDAVSTYDGSGVTYVFESATTMTTEFDLMMIDGKDIISSGQDETSLLKIIQGENINNGADGFALLELELGNTVTNATDDDESFYVVGRDNNEGIMRWGVSLTDADIWTEGGIKAGATGTDCAGTDAPCFNTPLFSVASDGVIAATSTNTSADSWVFTTPTNATGERDFFTIIDADLGSTSQDESSSFKVERSGNINDAMDGYSLVELSVTGIDYSDDQEAFYILGRNNDEGAPEWGVDTLYADFWTTGGIYAGAAGVNCGGTDNPCFNSPAFSVTSSGAITAPSLTSGSGNLAISSAGWHTTFTADTDSNSSGDAFTWTTDATSVMRIDGDTADLGDLWVLGDITANGVRMGRGPASTTQDVYTTVFGFQAFNTNQGNWGATVMGRSAMLYADNRTVSPRNIGTTAIGMYALMGSTTPANNTGINNTAVGDSTLRNFTSGNYNVALGFQAGDNITSGSQNIIIGYDIDAPSATADDQLSIGNLIFATGGFGTGTTVGAGKVGIGTASPDGRLNVSATSPAVIIESSSANNDASLEIAEYGTSRHDHGGRLYVDGTNNKFKIQAQLSGSFTDVITINYAGTNANNVGIGTDSPSAKLHIHGTSNWIQSTAASAEGGAIMQNVIDVDNSYARAVFGHNAWWDHSTNLWNVDNVGANDAAAVMFDNGANINFITHETTGASSRTFTHTNFENGTKMLIEGDGDIFLNSSISAISGSTQVLRVNTTTWEVMRDTSSLRYKKDVQDLIVDTSRIYNLRPVTFRYKEGGMQDFGLIAEEVYEVLPQMVVLDANGLPDGVNYDRLGVLLLNEMIKNQGALGEIETKVNGYESRISTIESKFEQESSLTRLLIDYESGELADSLNSADVTNSLNISDSVPGGTIAYLNNTASSNTSSDVLALQVTNEVNSMSHVYIDFGKGESFTGIGEIRNNGAGSIQYSSTGVSYGEYIPAETRYMAGMLVGVSRSTGKATNASANNVLGPIATAPAFSGGRSGSDKALVALAGQVPVLVDNSTGEITPGDKIGLSFANINFGSKRSSIGEIYGQALQSFAPSAMSCVKVPSLEAIVWPQQDPYNKVRVCYELPNGTKIGKVLMMVEQGWYDPSPIAENETFTALMLDYELGVLGGSYTGDVSTKNLTVGDMKANTATITTLTTNTIKSKSIESDTATVGDLTAQGLESATITSGDAIFQVLTVGMGFVVNNEGAVTISGDLLLGTTSIVSEEGTLYTNSPIVAPEVTTQKLNISGAAVEGRSIGVSVIPVGEMEVRIDTSAVNTNSVIFITPKNHMPYDALYVSEQGEGYFIVRMGYEKTKDIEFNWWSIN